MLTWNMFCNCNYSSWRFLGYMSLFALEVVFDPFLGRLKELFEIGWRVDIVAAQSDCLAVKSPFLAAILLGCPRILIWFFDYRMRQRSSGNLVLMWNLIFREDWDDTLLLLIIMVGLYTSCCFALRVTVSRRPLQLGRKHRLSLLWCNVS